MKKTTIILDNLRHCDKLMAVGSLLKNLVEKNEASGRRIENNRMRRRRRRKNNRNEEEEEEEEGRKNNRNVVVVVVVVLGEENNRILWPENLYKCVTFYLFLSLHFAPEELT